MTKLVLPKQWKHWCSRLNLRTTCPNTRRFGGYDRYYYTKGRGRHWRVNCLGTLDVSVPYEDFDRWALSCLKTFDLPKTFEEFKHIVESIK